jgi:hypothetical protein
MGRRRALVVLLVGLVGGLVAQQAPAHAGSPHFVGVPSITRSGDALTVSGKVAGLGNETQIKVTLTADVQCRNRGGNNPAAENKQAVIATGTFPVQNGQATFTLTGTGVTDPACNPPMFLDYRNVTVTVSGASFATFSYISPLVF